MWFQLMNYAGAFLSLYSQAHPRVSDPEKQEIVLV